MWRAAFLATIPFVVAHLYMFWMFPWPVALAAVLLSAVLSFPLAYLFDLGGRTIWGPAIVHFVVQGAIKLITVPGPAETMLPVVWMAAAAVLPFAVFFVRGPILHTRERENPA